MVETAPSQTNVADPWGALDISGFFCITSSPKDQRGWHWRMDFPQFLGQGACLLFYSQNKGVTLIPK